MKRFIARTVGVILVAFFATYAALHNVRAAGPLYVDVNSAACDDTRLKINNDSTHPWCSIGRAMWGSTTRSSPVAAQAADAGDVVNVAGGSYTQYNALNCSPTIGNCRFTVMYEAVNNGSSGAPIEVKCIGTCFTPAKEWNGPVCCATVATHVHWTADTTLGYKWSIKGYFPIDDNAAADEVDTTPDTGPVVCEGTGCWATGFDIDGGVGLDAFDNATGVRIEVCTDCKTANNKIRNITAPSSHGVGIEIYHSPNVTVEHNDIASVDVCIGNKNQPALSGTTSGNQRFNKCDSPGAYGFLWSINRDNQTNGIKTYQNIIIHPARYAFFFTGEDSGIGGSDNDSIFNNTVYNVSDTFSGVYFFKSQNGARVWNNIFHTHRTVFIHDGGAAFPASDTETDSEHNVFYNTTGNFYVGATNIDTMANFNSTFAGQNNTTPLSITSDPLLVNPAGGDFRICLGAGNPTAACGSASPANALGVDALDLNGNSSTTDNIPAGAYITNNEQIGIETSPNVLQPVISRIRIRKAEVVALAVVTFFFFGAAHAPKHRRRRSRPAQSDNQRLRPAA